MTPDPTPFSAIAQEYDAMFTGTAVGRLQRQIVWQFLEKIVAGKPLRVLEINCGTGEDALWLAGHGCKVLATDASPKMVAATREKALKAGLSITAELRAFADLDQLPEGDFDLIFSNFGGLNCVPPAELAALGNIFKSKLRPGGQFVAVVMGRFCCWETAYFLLKGRWQAAFRRLSKGPVLARLDEQTSVATWYYGLVDLNFVRPAKPAAQAVGFWLPPSYLNPFFEKRPRLLRGLFWLEKKCRGRFWAFGADHFLIHWQKKQ